MDDVIQRKRFRQADEILQQLLELPESAQSEFLAQSCDDNPALKILVQRLLAQTKADDTGLRPGGGLKMLGVETSDFAPRSEPRFSLGDRVGVYRLVRVLGRGGMASVYFATRDDGQFEQTVALKIIDRGGETLARFEQERQILASLDHPNIARLLDGGVTESGVPYVAMEYVEGLPLLEYCDRERLSIEQRLRLFNNIVNAVHDAHRSLVVHRDIKPANILVTAAGVPKLLDFGIAKLLEIDALPHAAPVTRLLSPMTPEYASPEQVRGERMTVATDIYQLGYLLYVLLTDQSPYAPIPTDMAALVDAITRCDPAAPSQRMADTSDTDNPEGGTPWAMRDTTRARLQRRLRGDLDRVVLKALHKDPEQRYGSAAELATDINNVVTDRPINARRDSARYRSRMFVQRHALAVGVTSATVLAIVIGASLFTYNLSHAKQQAELEAAKSVQVTGFLMGLFEANDPAEALGDEISARELLDRGAEQAKSLESQPEIQAQMFDVLGQMYHKLGQYDKARLHLSRALALRRERFGGPHADVASSLTSLGSLLVAEGEYAAAEELFHEALIAQRSLFGSQHPEVAASLNGLAATLARQGDLDAAEPLYREALAIRRAHFGAEHPDVAVSLNDLGLVLWEKGHYDEAESVHRQALSIQRRLFGDVHPDVAGSLNNLAVVLQSRGDYEAAASILRESLASVRKLLGDEHPEVALTLSNLAVSLRNMGNDEEAKAMQWQALAIRRKHLPENHPHTALSLNNLAIIYSNQKDFDRAEPLFREALAMRRASLGRDHPAVWNTLQNLAVMLRDRGDYEAAEAMFLDAIAIHRNVFGGRHPNVAYSLHSLASTYDLQGDAATAEPLHREAITIMVSALGEQHSHTVLFQLALASNLTVLGRFEEAETLLLGVQALSEDTGGNGDARLVWQKLAGLYDAWEKPDEAAHYRELSETRE